MLSNAYFLAKFRFDTAENEPAKNLRNFAKFGKFCHFCASGRQRASGEEGEQAAAAGLGAEEVGERLDGPLAGEGHVGRPGTRWTRRVVANFWQNFGKMLLVFGCIGTDLCKKIRVLQHFSKSTRLSS